MSAVLKADRLQSSTAPNSVASRSLPHGIFATRGSTQSYSKTRLFMSYLGCTCGCCQDPCDPRVRMVGFGDRHAYGQCLPSKLIWTGQPQDFGTADYGRRRAKAITKHLSAISEDRVELHRLFDDWLAPSVGLRQYLWAHRQESIDTARKVIEIIPPPMLKNLLRYLVHNYRGRCSGWPDLLLYRGNQWFLAEVKSWSDKLSKKQKRWIQDNHRYLHLPFKLVKVHRIQTISSIK